MSTNKDNSSRPILNAIAILEALAECQGSQSLAELSKGCKLPKATALRYLSAFESTGYVSKSPNDGRYSLGVSVIALSRKFYSQEGLLSIARAKLGELARATGETAHLAVLHERDIVYVDIAEGSKSVRAIIPRGDRLPAYCVASGRAILANSNSSTVEAILARKLLARTKSTITDPDQFRAELKRVLKRGYCAAVGECIEDVVGISAPLFSPEGIVFAAIGISSPSARIKTKDIDALGEVVRAHARRLSESFGNLQAIRRE